MEPDFVVAMGEKIFSECLVLGLFRDREKLVNYHEAKNRSSYKREASPGHSQTDPALRFAVFCGISLGRGRFISRVAALVIVWYFLN